MKILGRDPTLILAFVSSVITFFGTLNWDYLTPAGAALFVVFVNAVFAAINAWTVRPISPAIFTYLAGAGFAVAAHYGFDVGENVVAGVNAMIVTGLAVLVYGNVTPVETPLTAAGPKRLAVKRSP